MKSCVWNRPKWTKCSIAIPGRPVQRQRGRINSPISPTSDTRIDCVTALCLQGAQNEFLCALEKRQRWKRIGKNKTKKKPHTNPKNTNHEHRNVQCENSNYSKAYAIKKNRHSQTAKHVVEPGAMHRAPNPLSILKLVTKIRNDKKPLTQRETIGQFWAEQWADRSTRDTRESQSPEWRFPRVRHEVCVLDRPTTVTRPCTFTRC